MNFNKKKLNKIIEKENIELEQYSVQIETVAGDMNLEVREDTFDYLKSILIKYHESRLDVLVIDIVVKILLSFTIGFTTVIIALFMSLLPNVSKENVILVFALLITLHFGLNLIENGSFYKKGLDTSKLKEFSYNQYCFLRDNTRR